MSIIRFIVALPILCVLMAMMIGIAFVLMLTSWVPGMYRRARSIACDFEDASVELSQIIMGK